MHNMLQLKLKTNSLFIRLLVSFLIIIGLLISFNFYSFSFFRDNIRDEIIQYNNSNLNNMTENFEKHFQLINNLVLGMYMTDNVQVMTNYKDINYYTSSQLRRNIQNAVSNPLLYLDNLVLYFNDSSFILEKSGSTKAETMFSKFYQSKAYPYDFWKSQFDKSYSFHIFPASTFSEITLEGNSTSKGNLFPIIIKSKLFPDLYITAFADADKMIHAYHLSINENFYILDNQGNRLFSLDKIDMQDLPTFGDNQGYMKQGDYYYFYKKGVNTGLTYVNIISVKNISSQVTSLNYTLISLFIVVVAISIIASTLFSLRINNPVKQIMKSLQPFNSRTPVSSPIKEFQAIYEDLANKNSLLRDYAYTNKLKQIHCNFYDLMDLFRGDKPFIFILFQIKMNTRFHEEISADTDRATNFIREFISHTFSVKYADANTFQIESDQILSLIFFEGGENELLETLEHMKKVFDLDRDFFCLTIAVGTVHNHAADFTSAYNQVVERIQLRRLNDETQIIVEGVRKPAFALTSTLEKEFDINLQAGNDVELVRYIHKVLSIMQKQNAIAADYYQIAEKLCEKAIQTLADKNLKHELYEPAAKWLNRLADCHHLTQLEQFLEQFLSHAADLIRQRKEARDLITSFVFEYIENHYFEDISLDAIADKLNITGGYLSSYFKEKTGKNFIDYLNEVRINKAKDILLQSNLRIQDIALKVGYRNMNSFNRMFKKFSGLTPSEFRQTTTNSD